MKIRLVRVQKSPKKKLRKLKIKVRKPDTRYSLIPVKIVRVVQVCPLTKWERLLVNLNILDCDCR